MMTLFILICIFLILIYIFNPKIDETSEGDLLLWYSPLFKNQRKYVVLMKHENLW